MISSRYPGNNWAMQQEHSTRRQGALGATESTFVGTAPTLTDGVVLLNAFATDDVCAHVAGEDEEQARQFGWYPERSTEETARAAFDQWERDWADSGATRTFAVRDAETGGLVGGCQVRLQEKRMAELSYWTFPLHRRKGFGRRAVALACRFAFDTLGVERIEAYVEPDNLASRKVAEKVGFHEEGLLRKRELTERGERRDMVIYGLLPDDLLKAGDRCALG